MWAAYDVWAGAVCPHLPTGLQHHDWEEKEEEGAPSEVPACNPSPLSPSTHPHTFTFFNAFSLSLSLAFELWQAGCFSTEKKCTRYLPFHINWPHQDHSQFSFPFRTTTKPTSILYFLSTFTLFVKHIISSPFSISSWSQSIVIITAMDLSLQTSLLPLSLHHFLFLWLSFDPSLRLVPIYSPPLLIFSWQSFSETNIGHFVPKNSLLFSLLSSFHNIFFHTILFLLLPLTKIFKAVWKVLERVKWNLDICEAAKTMKFPCPRSDQI